MPGGGVVLLRCVAVLDELKLTGDQAVGVTIVKRSLEEPPRLRRLYYAQIESERSFSAGAGNVGRRWELVAARR